MTRSTLNRQSELVRSYLKKYYGSVLNPEGSDKALLKSQLPKRRFLKKKQPDDFSLEKSEAPIPETPVKTSRPISNKDFRSRFEKKLPAYKKMISSERKLDSEKSEKAIRESVDSRTSITPLRIAESLRSINESPEARDTVEFFQAESQKFVDSLNASLKRSLRLEFSEGLDKIPSLLDFPSNQNVECLKDDDRKSKEAFELAGQYDDLMLSEASKSLYKSIKGQNPSMEMRSSGNGLFLGSEASELNYNSIRSLKQSESLFNEGEVCQLLLNKTQLKFKHSSQEFPSQIIQGNVSGEKICSQQTESRRPIVNEVDISQEKEIFAVIGKNDNPSEFLFQVENRTGPLIPLPIKIQREFCERQRNKISEEEKQQNSKNEFEQFSRQEPEAIAVEEKDEWLVEVQAGDKRNSMEMIPGSINNQEKEHQEQKSIDEQISENSNEANKPNTKAPNNNKTSNHANDSQSDRSLEKDKSEDSPSLPFDPLKSNPSGVEGFFTLANSDNLLPAELIDLAAAGDQFFNKDNPVCSQERLMFNQNDFSVELLHYEQTPEPQHADPRLTLADSRQRTESVDDSSVSSTREISQKIRKVNNDFYLNDKNKISLKEEKFFAMPDEIDNESANFEKAKLIGDIQQMLEANFITEQPNPTKPPSPEDPSPVRFRQKSNLYTVIQTDNCNYEEDEDFHAEHHPANPTAPHSSESRPDELHDSNSLVSDSSDRDCNLSEREYESRAKFELALNQVIQRMLSSKAKVIQRHWESYKARQRALVSPESLLAKFLQFKKSASKVNKYKVESKIATQTHEYSMAVLQRDFQNYLSEVTKHSALARSQLVLLLEKNNDRMKKLRVIFKS
jgi:hypothetical protein